MNYIFCCFTDQICEFIPKNMVCRGTYIRYFLFFINDNDSISTVFNQGPEIALIGDKLFFSNNLFGDIPVGKNDSFYDIIFQHRFIVD